MSGVLNVVFICFLLHSVQCDEFSASLPKQIEVLNGSCVTIPCTFQIKNEHNINLHSGCKAIWKTDQTEYTGQTTGDLTQKNCTTTLYNLTSQNREYFFRLDCNNVLKYTFVNTKVNINVKDAPPTPILTPPTLNVREGESVSVQCSAPVPCLSAPPTLTWTPVLGDIQETLQEQQDKTYVKVSTLTFTASYLHHERNITCTADYSREHGTPVSAVSTPLTAQVTFSPQILNSSNCTGDSARISCLCETEGNPAPTLQWYFPEISAANLSIISEPLKSIISITQPQWRDPFTLVCHSSNSLGSDSHRLILPVFEQEGQRFETCQVMIPVFIAVRAVSMLALVCVLLFALRN